jgi:hypothetical protein
MMLKACVRSLGQDSMMMTAGLIGGITVGGPAAGCTMTPLPMSWSAGVSSR